MATNREANIALRISGGDGSRQEVEKVRRAMEEFGDDGKKSAQKVVDALSNIEKGEDKLERKISEGRVVTARDVAAMAQQYSLLEDEIRRTFGSLSKAPAEIQEAFAKSAKSVDSAKAKVRELTDTLQEQKNELQEGGEKWTGLGDAINKSLGPMGKFQAGAALGFAALREGWQIGQQLNVMFGTDMSLWEEALQNFGKKGGVVIRALSDNLVALGGLIAAALTPGEGYAQRLSAAMDDYNSTIDESAKKTGDLEAQVKKEEAAHRANLAALAASEDKQKLAKEAAEKLADAKKKLGDEIRSTTAALQAESIELEKAKNLSIDSEHGVINSSGAMKRYAADLTDTTARIAAQEAEVRKLAAAHGESDPMTRQAADALDQLKQSLANTEQRYASAKEETARYEAQQKAADAAIRSATEKTAALTAEQQKHTTELQKLGGAQTTATTAQTQNTAQAQTAVAATTAVAEATTKAADATARVKTEVTGWRDAQGGLHIVSRQVADATTAQADATKKVGEVTPAAATEVGKLQQIIATLTADMGRLEEVMSKVVGHLEKIVEHAPAAASGLDKVSKAGLSGDAGGSGANSGGTSSSSIQ